MGQAGQMGQHMKIDAAMIDGFQPDFHETIVANLRTLVAMMDSPIITKETISGAMLAIAVETIMNSPNRKALVPAMRNAIAILEADEAKGRA